MKLLPVAIMALASLATATNGVQFSREDLTVAGPSRGSAPVLASPSPATAKRRAYKGVTLWDLLSGKRRRAVPSTRKRYTCKAKPSGTSASSSSPSSSSSAAPSATSAPAKADNTTSPIGTNKIMAAYWPDWTANEMPPESIDFTKFDFINYAFALPTQNFDLNFPVDNTKGLLKRLVTAAHKGDSKVILALGGWGGSTYFSPAVKTASSRATFISNIKKVYMQYNLDGIDIDWEYPGQGNQGNQYDPMDAANLQTFLQESRQALPADAILSAAVAHNPWTGSNGQPVASVARAGGALDYILIMNYDVWGSSSNPGPNAPLADLCGNSTQPNANAAAGVKQWSAAGMPRNKILLGIPSYGYLNASSKQKLRARNNPHAKRATLTSDDGQTNAGQINFKNLVKQGALKKGADGLYVGAGGFTKYWDNCSDTPYLADGSTVVTYDDTSSLWDKGAFVAQAGIAGMSMWSVNGDTKDWDLVNAAISGMVQGGAK